MNKKILACIIIVLLVVVGGGIIIVNNNSKNNNDNTVTAENENTDTNDNNCTEENNSSDSDVENTDTNSDASTNNNSTNISTDFATVEDIDAAANAEIATNKDEAIKKLVDFYLGQDNTFMQNTTKVNLTTNSDNTITVSKTGEDSNTYYSGVSPLSDNSSDGLIITIENYDDSTKVYTYSLKNYSDVKSGNTSNILDNGTVPEKGDVTSNSKNK